MEEIGEVEKTVMWKKRESIELRNAAKIGDVTFLTEKVSKESKDYFLLSSSKSQNMLHIAAIENQVPFFKEAMKLLPRNIIHELLSAQDEDDGRNPLHYAADVYNYELVKSILDFYKNGKDIDDEKYTKPWLTYTYAKKSTPLHLTLPAVVRQTKTEDCALEIMSMDIEYFCDRKRNKYGGKSLLYCAIERKFNRVAHKILTSSFVYDVTGKDGFTPLHYAPLCSEEVQELLLDKHSDMIRQWSNEDGYFVLHQWAKMETTFSRNVLDKFPEIKTKLFKEAIFWKDKKGCNAMHHAAANRDNPEIAQILISEYQDVNKEAAAADSRKKGTARPMGRGMVKQASQNDIDIENEIDPAECNLHITPPWSIKDRKLGDTPLIYALMSKNEKTAAHILSLDPTLRDVYNITGQSPLFTAVLYGCDKFVNLILDNNYHPPYKMLVHYNTGATILHVLRNLQEETAMKLLKKFWWMINLRDHMGFTALDKAEVNYVQWLVDMLKNHSSLEKEPFDWKQACENKEIEAIFAFLDTCPNLLKICTDVMDTPLHHIRLDTYQRYLDLLKIPSIDEIKNLPNFDNESPLERAILDKEIDLAKALLKDKKVIQDKSSMKHLLRLYKENDDWRKMCYQINVDPTLTTGYVKPDTLGDMRTTLSVVAALLATITFAAAFTLPGGLNQDTGDAILAKKAAFIVFILADVYAMCTSMLVLLCLIWSMASNIAMSYVLVDRSVFILMQAVYGTMVAFMTGMYLVIARSSLWTTILIFVMCSVLVLLASIKSILHILIKLIPAANQERMDSFKKLEEGKASTSTNKELEKHK